jgi:type VI secretion system protein VasJ
MADGICNAARVLRTADPGNAAAYRLHRQGLWLTVTEAPPAEDGRTRLRAPGADLRRQLEAKAQASHFMELIQQAEDLSNQYLFWLDLHRLIAIAMDRLGALFIEARGIVAREMVSLINRVPSIRTLAFMDGTPFADTATQAWLDETIASYGSGGESASVSKGSEEDDALEQRFAEARELVTQGKVAEGIGLAAQLAPRAADERGRFAGRLKIAEIALIGGKPEVSRPILEALMVEVDDRKLDTWEPQLCAPVISALVTTYRSLGAEIEKATIQSLQGRLCRLDPVAALKWAGT